MPAGSCKLSFLVAGLLTLVCVESSVTPGFGQGVHTTYGVAGEKASIPCNVSMPLADDQVSLILWYRTDLPNPIYTLDVRKVPIKKARHFPSGELEGRAFFDTTVHPPVLIVAPATVEDEGDYKCRVDLRRTRTLILHTRLKIIVPPGEPIIMDEHGQRLRDVIGPYDEGSFLTLACEVDGGDPSPEVTWWRGTTVLDESFNVTPQGFVRNELVLLELQRSDLLAEFTCQASNTNLTKPKSSAVILNLNLRPLEVKIAAPRHPLSTGQKEQIVCETTGSRPRAILSWLKDGKKLTSGVTETVSDGGNLTVSTFTLHAEPDDNGKVLSCRAENPSLSSSAIEDEWIIKVHYAPIMTLSLGASISRYGIKEGSDVYLECNIRANPWVNEVAWQFEDKFLTSNKSVGLIISNQTLVLQRVRKEHRGRYKCLAANSKGQGSSDHLYLLVQFAPVCKLSQPKTYGVARTEIVNVTCEVEADPNDLTFRWALNNSLETIPLEQWASEGSRSVLSYMPRTMAGYGLLLCWGKNAIGDQKEPCVARIIPAGAPESPRDCTVTNQTSYSLAVECDPGYDGGLAQSFHLEIYNSVVEHLAANLTSAEQPVFRVNGLPSNTAFVLVLYSSNGKGRSNSVALMASTLAPAERRTAEADVTNVSPFLAILSGVIIVLIVLAIIVVAIVRSQNSKERVKEAPNTEDTTRCESPLKKEFEGCQDTSEKGPDIIPFANETEVYFTGSSSELRRHIRPVQKSSGTDLEINTQHVTDTRL